MNMVEYLSIDKVAELNLLALTLIKVKKADSPKILSNSKIHEVLEACKNREGDIYDKATVLLKGIVQKHAFSSGNRRTAFLVMNYFLITNGAKSAISDNPDNSKIMTGIREGYYSDNEIKEWIKHAKIKAFQR